VFSCFLFLPSLPSCIFIVLGQPVYSILWPTYELIYWDGSSGKPEVVPGDVRPTRSTLVYGSLIAFVRPDSYLTLQVFVGKTFRMAASTLYKLGRPLPDRLFPRPISVSLLLHPLVCKDEASYPPTPNYRTSRWVVHSTQAWTLCLKSSPRP